MPEVLLLINRFWDGQSCWQNRVWRECANRTQQAPASIDADGEILEILNG